MQKESRMTREDALALLDAFRLDCEEPPPPNPERLARRYVEIISGELGAVKKSPPRGRGE
jgi:hypothetical protein